MDIVTADASLATGHLGSQPCVCLRLLLQLVSPPRNPLENSDPLFSAPDGQPKKVRKVPPGLPSSVSGSSVFPISAEPGDHPCSPDNPGHGGGITAGGEGISRVPERQSSVGKEPLGRVCRYVASERRHRGSAFSAVAPGEAAEPAPGVRCFIGKLSGTTRSLLPRLFQGNKLNNGFVAASNGISRKANWSGLQGSCRNTGAVWRPGLHSWLECWSAWRGTGDGSVPSGSVPSPGLCWR